MARGELRDHAPHLVVDERKRVPEHGPRHPVAVLEDVAPVLGLPSERGGRQLLGGRDGLEVHAEERGNADLLGAPLWSKPLISLMIESTLIAS